jgi:hypothetical protein
MQPLRLCCLVPVGFVVEGTVCEEIEAPSQFGQRGISAIVHLAERRYQRRVADLPLAGRSVVLLVLARRFRCDAVLCSRQVFTERFADGVLPPSARRTTRLDCIVHHLGFGLPPEKWSSLMYGLWPDGGLKNGKEATHGGRDRHQAAAD